MLCVKHMTTLDKLMIVTNIKPTLVPIFDITFLSIYYVIIVGGRGGQAFSYFFSSYLGVQGVQKVPKLSYIIN